MDNCIANNIASHSPLLGDSPGSWLRQAIEEAAIRRAIELSATKYCPVNAMLSAGATEIHHGYRVRNTGPEPFEAEGEVVVTGPYRRPEIVR